MSTNHSDGVHEWRHLVRVSKVDGGAMFNEHLGGSEVILDNAVNEWRHASITIRLEVVPIFTRGQLATKDVYIHIRVVTQHIRLGSTT